jgi:hypothetical protein
MGLKALCPSAVGDNYHICMHEKTCEDIQEELEVSEGTSLIKVSMEGSYKLCAGALSNSRS